MFLAEHLLQDLAIAQKYIVQSYVSQVGWKTQLHREAHSHSCFFVHRSHTTTIFYHDKLNNNLAIWLRTNYNMGTFLLQIAAL